MITRIIIIIIISGIICVLPSALYAVKHTPEPINITAEKAEDIIDYFHAGDWQRAGLLADTLAAQQSEIDSLIEQNQMPQSSADTYDYLLFRLRSLTDEQSDSIQAALVANQITDIMIDLESHYPQTTPLAIARLDYLGREIVLLAECRNNYGFLSKRIDQLKMTWVRLRPNILTRNGQDAAARLDKTLESLNANDPTDIIIQTGNTVLDLVDELEALY